MEIFSWLALASYTLAFMLVVGFSIAYLKRSDFMPYHSVAVARPWREVEPRMRVLLLALIKLAGWAWLAIALAGFLLLYLLSSRNGVLAQLIVFQVFCLIAVTPPTAVALYVRLKTEAPTPVAIGVSGVVLTLLGFTFALLSGHYT
ncbi:hypothetical protein [Pseudomonas sp. R5(2019)]|uniref:hypothetical protein n=1 Tax=Pseudomonas sp. R5(2019) TaxID=2697566 RepID=UPI0014133CA2|nr:hypothetical protein [Pseudomonas sp. R5(2019)]NBA97172.1 hypothetical protein [Pseudomonas sp. R5(2019)]